MPTRVRSITLAPMDAGQFAALTDAAARIAPRAVVWTRQIAEIAAPTGDEGERAAFVQDRFAGLGLDTTVDELHDVVAVLPGKRRGDHAPAVLLTAHLDTVFVHGTPLEVRAGNGQLHGPGIGDNSVGVAAVLALPELFAAVGLQPAVDVLLTGNVGEEGLGNLRGIRAVMDANPRVRTVIAVEGHNLGRVTHVGVGSKRIRITATGPGGHSWGDFGRPSAIHALARVIAELADVPLSWNPKTTLNVGHIEGGISVNSIAPTASCLVDMRSTDERSLQALAARVDRIIQSANRHGVNFTAEILGERPAGSIARDAPLVEAANEILSSLGMTASFDASSTDANIALGRSIPAICIGITTGGNVHRVNEYIDVEPLTTGLVQLALLTARAAELIADDPDQAR